MSHRIISAVFLYRGRHAQIQASPSCSSSPSLSRYGRDQATMVISSVFQHKPLSLDILELTPIFPSVQKASRIGPDFQILHFKPFKNFLNGPQSLRCFSVTIQVTILR
ncbi:hypothetical protein F2Q70_00021316 [Brassica cretica]|uniref:Uncharacterized protein n=1 Tax=Brassica cretica TaxID=69181 RepID=A0A8S9GQW4_BRACR|nr:hypothetical protein F2Q70_00021316 [Brassica cretica]